MRVVAAGGSEFRSGKWHWTEVLRGSPFHGRIQQKDVDTSHSHSKLIRPNGLYVENLGEERVATRDQQPREKWVERNRNPSLELERPQNSDRHPR